MKNWKGFERSIAKMIIETFKDYGITEKDSYRTPMSGGHRYASKTDSGDIVLSPKLRKLLPVSCECKCYATVNLGHFLVPMKEWKKSWQCKQWLAQVVAATERQDGEKLIPLLVFKENNGMIMAAFPVGRLPFGAEEFPYRIIFKYDGLPWNIVRFKTFLRKLKVEHDRKGGILRHRDGRKEA